MPTVAHGHSPIYRVARSEWANPLDATFASRQSHRWNSAGSHAVLYTSSSIAVARAIVVDIFKIAALELEDLAPGVRPVLIELEWSGEPVDMASVEGLVECGFTHSYPDQIEHRHTQPFGMAWFALGAEGVLCRSASMFRIGHRGWIGAHEGWSELAIFVDNVSIQPVAINRREDFGWLH